MHGIIKYILSIIFLLVMATSFSQKRLTLDKTVRLDTLRLWIEYPENFNADMNTEYDLLVREVTDQFNKEGSFFVKIDSMNTNNSIKINMGSVKYVDTKRNILSTGLSLALIGGHVVMVSSYGWTLPIWPILLPATVSKLELEIDPKMVSSKSNAKYWIGSNGYLNNQCKQEKKFKKKFEKEIDKLLSKIDKQYSNQIKPKTNNP